MAYLVDFINKYKSIFEGLINVKYSIKYFVKYWYLTYKFAYLVFKVENYSDDFQIHPYLGDKIGKI